MDPTQPGKFPGIVPLFPAGKEPLPPGWTEDDREQFNQVKKWEGLVQQGTESCVFKTVLAGGAGFGLGAFFSLMSASFAYEDPMLRTRTAEAMNRNVQQKAGQIFKEMGRGMWTTGRSFGQVGALFSGIECVIEGYRGRNDIYNSMSAGFLAGGILARNSGPRAAVGGGLAFAAFSTAIDVFFIRRETPECVPLRSSPLPCYTLLRTCLYSDD